MAILSATVLSNCYYIPQFIASGTKMLFENASAPTSWTKDTTYNNRALRIVNGTVSFGGDSSFTNIFTTTKAVGGSLNVVTSGVSINPVPAGITIGIGTVFPAPSATSSTAASTVAHTHTYTNSSSTARISSPIVDLLAVATISTNNEGGNANHNHGVSATPHTHPFTNPSHTHTISESPHVHTLSPATQNFAVNYRDVILATKD